MARKKPKPEAREYQPFDGMRWTTRWIEYDEDGSEIVIQGRLTSTDMKHIVEPETGYDDETGRKTT